MTIQTISTIPTIPTMKVSPDSYMFEMIRTELADAVGAANVDVRFADKFGHSIDYYWIPEM